MVWTKKERKELWKNVVADAELKLEQLRRSGAVPDGFEDSEPASLPKIAVILACKDIGLTDNAKKQLKNLRHFV